jgi:hypothetical protein
MLLVRSAANVRLNGDNELILRFPGLGYERAPKIVKQLSDLSEAFGKGQKPSMLRLDTGVPMDWPRTVSAQRDRGHPRALSRQLDPGAPAKAVVKRQFLVQVPSMAPYPQSHTPTVSTTIRPRDERR